MNEEKLQQFQDAVERWKSGADNENDRQLIQDVLQTGGVNFGQSNQVSVSGSVIGTLNIQFQTADQARAFLAQLQQYSPPIPPPQDELSLVGNLPPGSRLPFARNAVFTGRELDLKALAAMLLYGPQEGQAVGIVSTVQAAAATGMGGIGKTQLAVEFCYRYGRYFLGVHWLAANQDIAAEIAECGLEMRLEPWPEAQEEQVRATLAAWKGGGPRLVVLDNLEDLQVLQNWRPRLGGVKVLLTSRIGRWPAGLGVQAQRLGALQREESQALLVKLAPHLEKVDVDELDKVAERYQDVPLGVHLAGSYLSMHPELSVGYYLTRLKERGGALKEARLPDWVGDDPAGYGRNLWATFEVGLEALEGDENLGNAALKMFLTSGYCAANVRMPRKILSGIVDHSAVFFGPANPDDPDSTFIVHKILRPLFERVQSEMSDWRVELVTEQKATKARLSQIMLQEPLPLLVTLGHGAAFPPDHSRQRIYQGGIVCQDWPGPKASHGELLEEYLFTGADIPADADLSGMICFHMSDYSLGTPRRSEAQAMLFEDIPELARQPFIASLPQALLTHGALAVVGLADKFWNIALPNLQLFTKDTTVVAESCLRYLLGGSTIGVAMQPFRQRAAELGSQLTYLREEAQFGKSVDSQELVTTWATLSTLNNLLIFGDPAVRLVPRRELTSS